MVSISTLCFLPTKLKFIVYGCVCAHIRGYTQLCVCAHVQEVHLSLCVCTRVCVYAQVQGYTHLYVCTHVCGTLTCVCIHVWGYTCLLVCVHTYGGTLTCVCTCMGYTCLCVYVLVWGYTCLCVHMYGAHAPVCVCSYTGVHSFLCLCVCSSIILCLIFRDRVSHWTWSSPLGLDTSPYSAHMLPGFCTNTRGPKSGHHNVTARILPIPPSSQFNKLKSSGDKKRNKHNHAFIHKMCCHHPNHCYYRPGDWV